MATHLGLVMIGSAGEGGIHLIERKVLGKGVGRVLLIELFSDSVEPISIPCLAM